MTLPTTVTKSTTEENKLVTMTTNHKKSQGRPEKSCWNSQQQASYTTDGCLCNLCRQTTKEKDLPTLDCTACIKPEPMRERQRKRSRMRMQPAPRRQRRLTRKRQRALKWKHNKQTMAEEREVRNIELKQVPSPSNSTPNPWTHPRPWHVTLCQPAQLHLQSFGMSLFHKTL